VVHLTKSGAAVAGLVAADLTMYYFLPGATAPVVQALSDLANVNTAFAAGGLKELSAAHAAGDYRLDLPDLMLAAGVDFAVLNLMPGAAKTDTYSERLALSTNISQTGDAYNVVKSGGAGDAAAIKTAVGTTIPALLPAALGSDGFIKASLWGALGTAFTESVAGYIAAAIKKFFNVATPVLTTASVNQTVANPAADASVVAIKGKTDLLPAVAAGAASGLALVGSLMTPSAAAIAVAVRDVDNGLPAGDSLGADVKLAAGLGDEPVAVPSAEVAADLAERIQRAAQAAALRQAPVPLETENDWDLKPGPKAGG
jgi:hypothetical protein